VLGQEGCDLGGGVRGGEVDHGSCHGCGGRSLPGIVIGTASTDVIPTAERHGRARQLFAVWAAPNISYLSLVVGALILMGLSLWQALAVIVAGNLFWALVGLLAVSGPASSTPSEVIMRAMFGIRGNRLNIAITGSFACVCYLALNWAAASLAAFSLAAGPGAPPGTAAKVAIIVAGTAVASQCLATPLFTGPIARAVGGTDLSLPAGLLVSAAIYLLMMRSRGTAAAASRRPARQRPPAGRTVRTGPAPGK
jgi:purine-cytosine permease-like protein